MAAGLPWDISVIKATLPLFFPPAHGRRLSLIHIFSGRLREHLDTGFPWLLAEEDGAVLGYAYAGRFAARRG